MVVMAWPSFAQSSPPGAPGGPPPTGTGYTDGMMNGGEGTRGLGRGEAGSSTPLTVELQRRYLNNGSKLKERSNGASVKPSPIALDPTGELAALAERRRGDAIALAARVRGGAVVPSELSAKFRQALDDDLLLWSRQFAVDSGEYERARIQWLPAAEAQSAQDWILKRAAWFEARDVWVAAARR